MLQTEHYKYKQYEGTDLFNPLTVEAQNILQLDGDVYDAKIGGVNLANELKTGTVHALTRLTPESPVFRFVATSNWAAGDTCVVDGVQVSTLLSTGEPLPAGAWVINSNVLCILNGTLLTVFTAQPTGGGPTEIDATTLEGHPASYFAVADQTAKKSQGSSVQLGTGLWTASGDKYTQSVSVAGVTPNAPNIVCSPAAASWDKAIENNVRMTSQGSGVVTFTADSVPDSVVYMNVLLLF